VPRRTRLLERIREVRAANAFGYGYRRTWAARRRGRPWRTPLPDPEARRRADLVQRDFGEPALRFR
jgi:hypothetical protein